MSELDLLLAQRLEQLAMKRGWTEEEALARAVERGLAELEAEATAAPPAPPAPEPAPGTTSFADEEAQALQAAIAALEEIPSDTFAAIGKAAAPGEEQSG